MSCFQWRRRKISCTVPRFGHLNKVNRCFLFNRLVSAYNNNKSVRIMKYNFILKEIIKPVPLSNRNYLWKIHNISFNSQLHKDYNSTRNTAILIYTLFAKFESPWKRKFLCIFLIKNGAFLLCVYLYRHKKKVF